MDTVAQAPTFKTPRSIPSLTRGVTSKYRQDTAGLLKLRLEQHLSYDQIALLTGLSKGTVYDRLIWVEKLVKDPEQLTAYESQRPKLLSGVEAALLAELTNPDKVEKASLNNVAYAFGQIHQARRLEQDKSTSNIGIHAELVESLCRGKVEDTQEDDSVDV
jgi:transposase